jgi:Eukaryotic translation initiation factor 3 subunit 8 N-terminus
MVGSSDSDSEDDKRVVRSAKDRRFDELKATCEEIRVRHSLSCLLACVAVSGTAYVLHTPIYEATIVHISHPTRHAYSGMQLGT